jgi:hypothetical protein
MTSATPKHPLVIRDWLFEFVRGFDYQVVHSARVFKCEQTVPLVAGPIWRNGRVGEGDSS